MEGGSSFYSLTFFFNLQGCKSLSFCLLYGTVNASVFLSIFYRAPLYFIIQSLCFFSLIQFFLSLSVSYRAPLLSPFLSLFLLYSSVTLSFTRSAFLSLLRHSISFCLLYSSVTVSYTALLLYKQKSCLPYAELYDMCLFVFFIALFLSLSLSFCFL